MTHSPSVEDSLDVLALDIGGGTQDLLLWSPERSMENSIQRQIVIEAKIIEVQLNNVNREGVNWDFINGRIGQMMFNFRQVFIDPLLALAPGTNFSRLYVGSEHLNIENTFIA